MWSVSSRPAKPWLRAGPMPVPSLRLTANGKVVGKSIANEVGEWTIILDEPLKPGDYDVGLEVHDEAGEAVSKSEEHVVVSLPEGGKEQPLVVLNSPEGPSDILQKPAAGTAGRRGQPRPPPRKHRQPAAETGTAAAAAPETGTRSADTKPAEVAAVEQAKAAPEPMRPSPLRRRRQLQRPTAGKPEPQPAAPAAQQEVAAAGRRDTGTRRRLQRRPRTPKRRLPP